MIKNSKTKGIVGAYISRNKKTKQKRNKKKADYIGPTMNCYPRNG